MKSKMQKAWDDPEVREARCTKHKVKVDGVLYHSAHRAFVELGLDVKKCIKFRMHLKQVKTAVYEGHTFQLVEYKK